MTNTAPARFLNHGKTGVPSLLRSPILALTLAALFWSGSFVVGRALRDDVNPVALTFFRWLISFSSSPPSSGAKLRATRMWRFTNGG